MSGKEFLQNMVRSDACGVDHDIEACGPCHHRWLGAQVARDHLATGAEGDAIRCWTDEHQRRWEESKFYRLYLEEQAAGRDPRAAFEARGWTI